MLTLHIDAQNYDDLRAQAMTMLGIVPLAVAAPVVEESRAPMAAPTSLEPGGSETLTVKKAPGRPKKPVGVPVVVEETLDAPLTLESVRAALQSYATRQADQTVGIVKVREVLGTFMDVDGEPCQKISQIQPKDYAALRQRVSA